MPDTVNANTLMTTLRAQLDVFNSVLAECVTTAIVYQIPLYDDGLVPQQIKPDRVDGDEAVELAMRALRGFSRPLAQHPGSVLRLPGVVCADKNMMKPVAAINKVKSQLQDYIQTSYPDARARNCFCRSEFPGRVMLQVYRKIYVNDAPVQALRFTWSPYTEATKTLTRRQTLDLLTKRNISGIDHTDKNRFKALDIAIETVQKSGSGTKFAIKKPRSPYPIATIYHTRGTNAKKTVIPGSLPLILGPSCSGEPIDIGELPAYDKNIRKKKRSDKIPMQLLFKPLYLFVRQ